MRARSSEKSPASSGAEGAGARDVDGGGAGAARGEKIDHGAGADHDSMIICLITGPKSIQKHSASAENKEALAKLGVLLISRGSR